MTRQENYLISIVVPLYNEKNGLETFHKALLQVLADTSKDYEIIYVDDGSTDDTAELVQRWHADNSRIKLLKLSRNFGKESAVSAGIAAAGGHAIITLDGDGQHPLELIPQFIASWKNGAQVVIGVRVTKINEGWFKRFGGWLFYKAFNKMTGQKLIEGSTDFRLIDRVVQEAFLTLHETDRLTRGLIDWLGFRRELIYFNAHAREEGSAGYTIRKLAQLAVNSFVSLTPTPLYLFGYLGIFITLSTLLLGLSVIVEQLLLGDPWHWKFTGTAMLAIMILFLVGVLLVSQGILSLYISHMHNQTKQRPLYVIDQEGSAGIPKARISHEV